MRVATSPADATTAGRGREKAAAILAAFVGLAAGYPSVYGSTTTAFIVPLTQEFGWGRTVPSLMYMCANVGLALMSFWLGSLIERVGAATVAAGSGLCLCAILLLLSMQGGSVPHALVLAFLAGALGAGTGVGLYLSVLPRWFDRDLGRALGFSILGQSAGLTVMPALAATVVTEDGWRRAYQALATAQIALTLVAATILWWLARRARVLLTTGRARHAEGLDVAEALGTRTFWTLGGMMLLATLGIFGAAVQLFPLLVDRGIPGGTLPSVAVALGVGTLIGRLGSGFLLDFVEGRLVAALTFTAGAAAILWLAFGIGADASPGLYVATALLGAALGAESDVLAYLVRRHFGMRHYSAIYNRALIGYFAGAVIGPLSLGLAFDRLATPVPALVGLAISCLLAIGAAALLPPSRKQFA